MLFVFVVLFVAILALGLVIMVGLRRWGIEQSRTEAHLRAPGTHTLSYAIPNGQDPAVVVAGLTTAGFTSVAGMEGGVERVLVECDEQDRAKVRSTIEHVGRAGFDGPPMLVSHVRFDDES